VIFYSDDFDNPWRFKSLDEKDCDSIEMDLSWRCDDWELIPEPKLRQMTRQEMVAFIVENRGNIMVRIDEGSSWDFPEFYGYTDLLEDYQYCYFTIEKGAMVFGEAKSFMIEEANGE